MDDLTEGYILNNRYEIHEKVGEGGMSFVYRAIDLESGSVVAVKVLKKEFCYDDEFIKRFRNEATAAQKLCHPNIVAIFDMGNDNDIQYIVMEYIDGLTLDKLIKAKKKLPWRNTLKITAQILSAVEHAHSHKIIHRDIKPLNIMLTEEGVVKLTDFGIARAVSSATKSAASDSAGSVHYLSPEQVRGGFVDERSDIYSIGITMYEMITGSVPYDGDSHVSIALKHIDGKIKPPHEVDPTIPYGVSDLIVLATKKETNKRFQSAGEMYERLLKVMKNPYVSFLVDYENTEEETDMTVSPDAEEPITLGGEGGTVIEEDNMVEEKNAMVRDVVFQTVSYLAAVIVSILVLIFIISRHNMVKKNFKNYNIVQYKVENYTGMLASTVKEMIENCGIRVEQELVDNEEYPAGYIIGQSAKAGEILRENDVIKLSVTAKEGSVIVDDYSGKSFQAVGTQLSTQDIKVEYKELSSSKYEDGKIIRTSPGPGSILEKNDTITIYYSSGTLYKKVTVPKLVGLTLEEAMKELGKVNISLNVGVVYPSPSAMIDDLLTTPTPSQSSSATPSSSPTTAPTASPSPQTPTISPDDIPSDLTVDPEHTPDVGENTGSADPTTGTPMQSPTVTPTQSATPLPVPTHTYASDKVVAQYPAAGTEIMANETVNLYFYDVDKITPRKKMYLEFPADFITGNACFVRIEAVMTDSNRAAEIVYMGPSVPSDKFPLEYEIPMSLNKAPTKVYIYIGEVGGDTKLYKVINVHG